MGKNYDNWERLVTAVLRRERDKETALNHSRDSSTIFSTSTSLDLSFASTSQFDHDDQSLVLQEREHDLPMDYSDLTLDHNDWKTMLPPHKREVVWRSASLSFFLDQWTRKNCFLLGATKVVSGCNWEMKSHPKSRFSEVAELVGSWELDVRGRIKTQMLSPETLYAAYLVFGLTDSDKYVKLESATSSIRFYRDESNSDYSIEQTRIMHFQLGNSRNSRADGWMEEELGDFYVGEGDNLQVEERLLETSGYEKNGLVLEGVEFRPLVKTTSLLVSNQEEGKRNKGEKSFFLDQRTRRNCFFLGAKKLIMASGDGSMNCWERKYHPKSRFSEVAELIDSRNLYIEGNIETKMLSPETSYAAYLVFGFTEKYAKLHSAVSIIRNFYDELGYEYPEEQARIVHFQLGNGRADGWMEIQLGDFYVGLEDNGEVQLQLLDTSGFRKSGLVIEGIEFRPWEGKRDRRS